MSASMTTTGQRMPLQVMPGGIAGWLQRTLAAPSATAAALPEALAERVYATAWPVRREADVTMYRCRVWDGMRASEPFFVRAPHGFLGAEPAQVFTALAAANEDAFNILRRTEIRGLAIEFNQEHHGTAVVSDALQRLSQRGVVPQAAFQ